MLHEARAILCGSATCGSGSCRTSAPPRSQALNISVVHAAPTLSADLDDSPPPFGLLSGLVQRTTNTHEVRFTSTSVCLQSIFTDTFVAAKPSCQDDRQADAPAIAALVEQRSGLHSTDSRLQRACPTAYYCGPKSATVLTPTSRNASTFVFSIYHLSIHIDWQGSLRLGCAVSPHGQVVSLARRHIAFCRTLIGPSARQYPGPRQLEVLSKTTSTGANAVYVDDTRMSCQEYRCTGSQEDLLCLFWLGIRQCHAPPALRHRTCPIRWVIRSQRCLGRAHQAQAFFAVVRSSD